MDAGLTAKTARSATSLHTIKCRACAKLHRCRQLPRDAESRQALRVRFTCLGCGHTETAGKHKVQMRATPGGAPQDHGARTGIAPGVGDEAPASAKARSRR